MFDQATVVRSRRPIGLAKPSELWDIEHTMISRFLIGAAFFLCLATTVEAQITSAGRLTRRIDAQKNAGRTPPPAAPGAVARPAGAAAVAPVPVDPEKVQAGKDEVEQKRIDYQKKRAEEGSDSAQFDLALRYLTGNGVEKNDATGMKWLEASAKGGNSQATKKLAELKKKEKEKAPADSKK